MKHILLGLILIYSIINIIFSISKEYIPTVVVMMLTLLIVIIIKERFFNHFILTIFEFILVIVYINYNPLFSSLLAICVLDIVFCKKYIFLLLVCGVIFIYREIFSFYIIFFYILVGLCSYVMKQKEDNKKYYLHSLDTERKLRYELENTKRQLIKNSQDIERLTEIKERNRIARNIHDNIGHDIAGVLFQLQGANKILSKEPKKVQQILTICCEKLSNSLNMIRNTVYNIKPSIEINEDLLKDIVNKFIFCPIDFVIEGNLNQIAPSIFEIIMTNLKEVLTNASKHSSASLIKIKIETNANFLRFYYHDNGKGCLKIKDGLGLSGMKSRIKNVNGMINIDGQNGFTIIIVVPLNQTNIFK